MRRAYFLAVLYVSQGISEMRDAAFQVNVFGVWLFCEWKFASPAARKDGDLLSLSAIRCELCKAAYANRAKAYLPVRVASEQTITQQNDADNYRKAVIRCEQYKEEP